MDEHKRLPSEKAPIVLVIDDSDVDRQVMADLLKQAGFVVHEMPTPIGATKAARESKARIVIIDQNLPALNGAKLATVFRNSPSLKDICVVLISSDDAAVMADLVREAKADAFVSKAQMHTELVATIRKLIS